MNSKQVQQAVILAGGRGLRLGKFTKFKPKPMYEIENKPFLFHLIKKLKQAGFKKILILLGYKSKIIKDYIESNSFNIKIEFHISNLKYETSIRLKKAIRKLENIFFVFYCDNFFPINKELFLKKFLSLNTDVQLIAYSNKDHITKNNIMVDKLGFVQKYDSKRKSKKLNCVNIGSIILSKKIIENLPNKNLSLENNLFPELIEKKKLSAFIIHHKYYSISNESRILLTKLFFKKRKFIFLDRDGVINKKMPKGKYVKEWKDWKWINGSIKALQILNKKNYNCIIITNQACIADKQLSILKLNEIHAKLKKELALHGGKITKIYYSPHSWKLNNFNRKPNPGMFFSAQRDFDLDLSNVTYIGDDNRDKLAAKNAGCKFIKVNSKNNLLKIVNKFF